MGSGHSTEERRNRMRFGMSRVAVSTYNGSSSMPQQVRPVRSAAIKVDPEPRNASSTRSPRAEQASNASATNATGFRVGWGNGKFPSSPLLEALLIDGYSQTFVRLRPYRPS